MFRCFALLDFEKWGRIFQQQIELKNTGTSKWTKWKLTNKKMELNDDVWEAIAKTFWITSFLIICVLSTLLPYAMQRILNAKHPLLINVVDLLSLDYLRGNAIVTAIGCIVILVRIAYGPFSHNMANASIFLLALQLPTIKFYPASMAIIRYLLIFHYNWLNNYLDQSIQVNVRVINITVGVSITMCSVSLGGYSYAGELYRFLSGKEYENASPPNSLILVIILSFIINCLCHVYYHWGKDLLLSQEWTKLPVQVLPEVKSSTAR